MTGRRDVDLGLQKLREAQSLIEAAHRAQSQATDTLQRALKDALNGELTKLPADAPPPSEHRRTHKPGRPPKIASDPELQAFIAARIDRMTFVQIAREVASAFPPARRVGKSAIHAWWQRNRREDRP